MNEYAISEKPLSFLDKSPICVIERRKIILHRRSKNDWQDFPLPLDNSRKCKEINRFLGLNSSPVFFIRCPGLIFCKNENFAAV
jgi:hypothetical protein